ncbi:putative transposase, Ptta/En/Spm, plant [Sesbania bispinosa]|nr:putative transposase, Ptta/En/Spm, plant [Sesbania bispinosa]
MAKTVWERTCMDRYPDYLAKARAAAFVRANSTNIADLKGHGPKGMRTEVWDGLVDIWMTPEWQRKSAAGKSNRAAKPDSMVHTEGSRSFVHHKKKDEKYGEDSSTYPAVGENKKSRVHDIGRSVDIGTHGSTHASSSDVVGPSTHPTLMTNEDVTTTINASLTSFMETQISQMQEQMQAQMQFFRTEILPVLKTQTQHSVQQPGENKENDNDDDASLG